MYDVFVSHNMVQKPWVRALSETMRRGGLRVFLDEDLPLGARLIPAIQEALSVSRYVLLVLSKESLSSPWVSLEYESALLSELDRGSHNLVPIVLPPLETEEIPTLLRLVNFVDLREEASRERALRKLFKGLHLDPDGVTSNEYAVLADLRPVSGLHAGGVPDVLNWGWNGLRLLEELIRLDYATLDGLQQAHEGVPEQWGPVFMNHPDTWRMLYARPGLIAGYWHFAPLFPDDYELAMRGGLLDSSITADRVRFFELPGKYDIYFVQICLDPLFRSTANVQHLFLTVAETLGRLASYGVMIDRVCANAYTAPGVALCRSVGFQPVCAHAERGTIFSGSVLNFLSHPIAKRARSFARGYGALANIMPRRW